LARLLRLAGEILDSGAELGGQLERLRELALGSERELADEELRQLRALAVEVDEAAEQGHPTVDDAAARQLLGPAFEQTLGVVAQGPHQELVFVLDVEEEGAGA